MGSFRRPVRPLRLQDSIPKRLTPVITSPSTRPAIHPPFRSHLIILGHQAWAVLLEQTLWARLVSIILGKSFASSGTIVPERYPSEPAYSCLGTSCRSFLIFITDSTQPSHWSWRAEYVATRTSLTHDMGLPYPSDNTHPVPRNYQRHQ